MRALSVEAIRLHPQLTPAPPAPPPPPRLPPPTVTNDTNAITQSVYADLDKVRKQATSSPMPP
eukprot:4192140-Pyramimonas_sp.AAC.1